MLSYQHAYHAAGPADLHKHIVLANLIFLLTRKKRAISYAETHAGRAIYDLTGAEAARTGEAQSGIALMHIDPASPWGQSVTRFRANYGVDTYPGSPALARELLRDGDSMTLMELHPAENAALRQAMAAPGTAIHRRDGLSGVLSLAPLKPRRGLVLVDPSYEVKSEYTDIAGFTRQLIRKWPQAVVLIWYPLLPAGRHTDMLKLLGPLNPLIDETEFLAKPDRGMYGSGLVLVNGPYGAEKIFRQSHKEAAAVLRSVNNFND